MEIAVIIAICTSSFTAIMAVANMLVSVSERKKSNRLVTVTAGRIKYLDQIRAANTDFTSLTNVAVIRYCSEKKENYPAKLCAAVAFIKTWLKPFYTIEQKMLRQIDNLENICLNQYNDPQNDLSEEIKNLRIVYDKLFAQYDWSYWKYIQCQYDGRFLDSNLDFDAIYEQMRNELESTDYTWEI